MKENNVENDLIKILEVPFDYIFVYSDGIKNENFYLELSNKISHYTLKITENLYNKLEFSNNAMVRMKYEDSKLKNVITEEEYNKLGQFFEKYFTKRGK